MNRGFITYFKEALSASFKTIVKNKGHFKFYLYFFLELLARVLIVPGVLFDVANARFAKTVKNEKQIKILDSFKNASKGKAILDAIVASLLKGLIFLAGVLVIALFTAVLFLLGFSIGYLTGDINKVFLFGLYFCIPGAIVLIGYLLLFPFFYCAYGYVIDTDKSTSGGEALTKSFETFKRKGKLTLLLNNLVPFLAVAAFGGLTFLLYVILLNVHAANMTAFTAFLVMFVLFVCAAVALFFLPLVVTTAKVANVLLYEDIVDDFINESKTVVGVKIRKYKVNKIDKDDVNAALVEMFDDNIDVSEKASKDYRSKLKESKFTDDEIKEAHGEVEETPVVEEKALEDSNENVVETNVQNEQDQTTNNQIDDNNLNEEETIEVVNEETSENTEQEDDSNEEETTDNVTFNN